MKQIQTLKILFIVLAILMITSIIFGVMTEDAIELTVSDRILAGLFGTFIVILINYVIYKFLSKIWK
ncbi:hypothetical protein [Fictibacillus phosphorivorans]|uniref:Uncharacterized protein n=1 Tax=Fictibacillus phosphorivorans TaxID=1221500 RepID=A0A160IPZ1_9BACL|nr:hypothetical protein [Fictibacillus phosphorivorans]ANC78481.1 hypothetical protein ABE65_017410 [Fictibacillus phosphorivorans]MQR94935.1 hypothetical protein [Fictibacillus phosphorivorans]